MPGPGGATWVLLRARGAGRPVSFSLAVEKAKPLKQSPSCSQVVQDKQSNINVLVRVVLESQARAKLCGKLKWRITCEESAP